jgi:hypothetical protein
MYCQYIARVDLSANSYVVTIRKIKTAMISFIKLRKNCERSKVMRGNVLNFILAWEDLTCCISSNLCLDYGTQNSLFNLVVFADHLRVADCLAVLCVLPRVSCMIRFWSSLSNCGTRTACYCYRI